ncbi:MAG TPA: alpha/beta hydrolase [Saprospiraceae bacterium]|nr:alpha/beta hydrolase [Saprospiraceae bacterium]HMQ82854.1 alpha/beta hydrolase [Saprospiraceae bacterium]
MPIHQAALHDIHYAILGDEVRIAYVEKGRGDRVLLFIHGLGSNFKGWSKLVEDLKNDFRCIAIDLPGYGYSDKKDYPFGIPFFSRQIIHFIQALGLRDVYLVGHSMGGQIAVDAVLKAPELFRKLILLAPAGFEVFNDTDRQWVQQLYQPQVIKGISTTQIKLNFKANFYHFPKEAHFMIEDRLHLRKQGDYDYFCRMISACVSGMLATPVFDRLEQLTLPTLAVYGEKDQLIPNKFLHPTWTTRKVAEAGTAQIPGSQLHLIPKCGHFVPWEGHKQVAAWVLAY